MAMGKYCQQEKEEGRFRGNGTEQLKMRAKKHSLSGWSIGGGKDNGSDGEDRGECYAVGWSRNYESS
jgi:hypothetical protein